MEPDDDRWELQGKQSGVWSMLLPAADTAWPLATGRRPEEDIIVNTGCDKSQITVHRLSLKWDREREMITDNRQFIEMADQNKLYMDLYNAYKLADLVKLHRPCCWKPFLSSIKKRVRCRENKVVRFSHCSR